MNPSEKKSALKIYYDQDCSFCVKGIRWIQKHVLKGQGYAAPAFSDAALYAEMLRENSWIVIDYKNRKLFRFDGVLAVMECGTVLQWLVPFLKLKPFHFLGTSFYKFVANNRSSSCKVEASKNK